jgi:L-arabinokinase
MYQSHDAYTECGLGSSSTSAIVEIVQALGPTSGLYGAKITGGGAGGTVCILGLRTAITTFQQKVVDVYHSKRCRSSISSGDGSSSDSNSSSGDSSSEYPHVFVGSSIGADEFGIQYF